MALVKAVILGTVAAVAIPYAAGGADSEFVRWVTSGTVYFSVGALHLAWSWPIFCVVTLFTWLMTAWANR